MGTAHLALSTLAAVAAESRAGLCARPLPRWPRWRRLHLTATGLLVLIEHEARKAMGEIAAYDARHERKKES